MKRFFQIWLIALAAKTALAIWLPFSNDEAYYWAWGHHPQWSYFDHPPMVGWLFWLGTLFEGIGNGARLPGVWLGHATLLIWNQILKPYLNEQQRRWWLIFILFSPFFGLGSLIITPDVPLLFFWSLALLLLLRLLEKPSSALYTAFGVSLGLGFCSKYMMVLFVPIAFLWIAWSRQWKRIRWNYLALTFVGGLLFCLPVLYWNQTHDWASFRFQLEHGLNSEKWQPIWPLEYLGGQILILFPLVVWLAIQRREPKETRFLHLFGWLPLAFFFYTSFKAHVEANWPIMAHPAILTLAFLNSHDLKFIRSTIFVWALALIVVLSKASVHWLPIDEQKLKTAEFHRFDVFLAEIPQHENLYLGSYQMAAALSYKLRRQIYKLDGLNRRDFYDFVAQSHPKSDSFAVGLEADQSLPAWVLNDGYQLVFEKRLSNDFKIVEVKRSAQGTHR